MSNSVGMCDVWERKYYEDGSFVQTLKERAGKKVEPFCFQKIPDGGSALCFFVEDVWYSENPKAEAKPCLPRECPCGIYREDCEYHKS